MNRQVIDLGFILKHVPGYTFSMDEFSDRLKLQKLLYLLQASGIYPGYDFSWYLRGPYCSILTANAFALASIYDDIPEDEPLKFTTTMYQKHFRNFLEFVKQKDTDSLEIAAYIHCFKKIHKEYDDEKIKKIVFDKQPRFEMETIDNIWQEIRNVS